jgi:hypothetical protein
VYAPGASEEVVREAMPPLSVAVPRTVEPFLTVMVSPFDGIPAVELTVAVKVTACPASEGLSEETSVVDVEERIEEAPRNIDMESTN